MGGEDTGDRVRIPGRINDSQDAWKTFVAWLIQDPVQQARGAGGTSSIPSSKFFYLLKILWFVSYHLLPAQGLQHLQYFRQPT